jgi:hypothetical protein
MLRMLALIPHTLITAFLLIGGLGAIYLGGRLIWISWRETKPTAFQAESFAQSYQGENWLSVEGVLLFDQRQEFQDRRVANGPPILHCHIPLAPSTWEPGQPLHVVLSLGGRPRAEIDQWIAQHRMTDRHIVSGLIPPFSGNLDYRRQFPNLKFESPVVYVNENTQPSRGLGQPLFLIGIGLVFTWYGLGALRQTLLLIRTTFNPQMAAQEEPRISNN